MVTAASEVMCLKPLTLHVVTTCPTGTMTASTASTLRMVTETRESTTGTVYPELSMVTPHEMADNAMPPTATTTFSMVTPTEEPIYNTPITALPVVTDKAPATTLPSTESSLH